VRFELLSDHHRVDGFSCGEPKLDRWLVDHALTNQRRGLSRTFVAVNAAEEEPVGEGVVAGHVTLVATAVEVERLPSRERRGLVGLDQVGAALIARLARDERHRKRQLGAWLLQRALYRVIDADQHLAIRVIVVDALNEHAASWYAEWGFKPLPGGPANRLWLPMKRVRASLYRP
jgi:GNAT superfamily N-acetyltransferase